MARQLAELLGRVAGRAAMIAVAAVALLAALDYHPDPEGISKCAFRENRTIRELAGARGSGDCCGSRCSSRRS